jgi:hypothetical protein
MLGVIAASVDAGCRLGFSMECLSADPMMALMLLLSELSSFK